MPETYIDYVTTVPALFALNIQLTNIWISFSLIRLERATCESWSTFQVIFACVAGAACQRGTLRPLDGVMFHGTAKLLDLNLPPHQIN